MTAVCTICSTELDIDSLEGVIDHLREEHSESYVEPERWPDGALVVYDETLEPEDFAEEAK